MLLPNESLFTKLIILFTRKQVYHGGVKITLCKIPEKYWIVWVWQNICKLSKKCYVCKIVQGKTSKPVKTPTLLSYRLSCKHGFENVGFDLASLLYYINNNGDKKLTNCCILLFTDCFSRGIRLELRRDINSKTFSLALRKFISKRWFPKIIVFDNFESFKSGEVKSFVASKGTK